jgi:hypothetical protein
VVKGIVYEFTTLELAIVFEALAETHDIMHNDRTLEQFVEWQYSRYQLIRRALYDVLYSKFDDKQHSHFDFPPEIENDIELRILAVEKIFNRDY